MTGLASASAAHLNHSLGIMSSVGQVQLAAREILSGQSVESPALDAQVLLAEALGCPRSWLVAHPDYLLTDSETRRFDLYVQRRATREPVAYILGHREFYGLEFSVTPSVLIPRPETELLVDCGLAYLRAAEKACRCLDVGTGSGCIAVAMAWHARKGGLTASVEAVDISEAALEVARENAQRHGLAGTIRFVHGDLIEALGQEAPGHYDLILSNPPYIPSAEIAGLQTEVRGYEPLDALDGGPGGLDVIRWLLAQANALLVPAGRLLMEIGMGQADAVTGLTGEAGLRVVDFHRDLAGIPRVAEAALL